MPIITNQAFAKFPQEAQIVGRLLAEYSILEIDLMNCDQVYTSHGFRSILQWRKCSHFYPLRRPKHLLSGLLVCGECGANVIVKSTRDDVTYFACSDHTNRGGCKNRKTARSDDVDKRVLAGLKRLLLDPARIELAINAYRAEWKRLQAERAKTRSSVERELATVKASIQRIMEAIHAPGGGQIEDLVQSLSNLRQQRELLEARLSVPNGEVIELHPHAARRYREIVEAFSASLAEGGPAAAKAMDLVRSLITRVRVIPTSGRQPVGLEIEGNLQALINDGGELRPALASQTAPVAIVV